MTTSQVTAYDNAGHGEMYIYSPAENRRRLRSCRPDGTPPTADTLGSQNGLFLTDDGRVFFSTKDAAGRRRTPTKATTSTSSSKASRS